MLRATVVILAIFAASTPARASETADRLRSAANLAGEGSWDEAVAALPDVSAVDRSDLPALQNAALALRPQRPAVAAHLWAAMRRMDPDAVRPRTALEALWGDNPTLDGIEAGDLDQYPVEFQRDSYGPFSVVTLALKPFVKHTPALEPSTGTAFDGTECVYSEAGGRLHLRFLVHSLTAASLPRARQVGRFLATLADLTDPLLGPVNRAEYPVPVWLDEGGTPGARQWNGAITIQAAGHDRSDAEWVRELSHEWGHACLPGIDGFTAPEAWANGDLGERLFVPLLAQSGRLAAWTTGVDMTAYQRKYVERPLNSFAALGPVSKTLANTGQAGYDHFLGAALYISQAYGTKTLMKALDAAGGGSASGFLRACADVLAPLPVVRITHIGPPGPRPICIPRSGRYSLDGHRVRRNGQVVDQPVHLDQGWIKLEWEGVLSLGRAGAPGTPSSRNR
jgi:hypothetical protein